MRSRRLGLLISLVITAFMLWGWGRASRPMQATSPYGVPLWSPSLSATASGNLLRNGSMDSEPFYWRPTNHYIAGGWYEWWVGDPLPEFIDGGIIYHNVCYPPPPPGKICVDDMHNSSQGYIRWGAPYIAGIYQPVAGVTPCLPYRLTAYNRNDSARYRPRVGIEPTGWVITRMLTGGTYNCPPDGFSQCPDPRLESEDEFPSTMVWSDYGDHAAYTWAPIAVTAEPVSTTISVWLYAAPLDAGPLSTYWDAASLTRSTYPGDVLPEPDDWAPSTLITSVHVITALDYLFIDWTTTEPTLGQLWYTIQPASSVTSTPTLTQSLYLPFVTKGESSYSHSPLDYTYKTDFSVTLHDLHEGDTVRFVILGRRLAGDHCQTDVSAFYEVVIHIPPLHDLYLPVAMRGAQ